jgi:hypothetical protein
MVRIGELKELARHAPEAYEQAKKNRDSIRQNAECIEAVGHRLDEITRHIKSHDEAAREMLEAYYFNKKLKKLVVAGTAFGVTIVTLLLHTSELFSFFKRHS